MPVTERPARRGFRTKIVAASVAVLAAGYAKSGAIHYEKARTIVQP